MNNYLKSKSLGIITIALIYLFTYIVSFSIGELVNSNVFIKYFIIDIIATLIIFLFSSIFKNSSIYDPYWSLTPLVILLHLFVKIQTNNLAAIGFILVFILYSVRLTLNFFFSFKNLKTQDWRYDKLQLRCKKFYFLVNLFGIHLFPTLVVYLCIIPAIYFLKINVFNPYCYIGIFVMLLGVIIELVSDSSLRLFRKSPYYNPKDVYRLGLWKYSRHPNYFGEILFYYGVAFASLPINFHLIYLLFPLINNLMFIFISIPMIERRFLTYKENYSDYIREVRMLIPFKK